MREVRQRCGFGCVICGLPIYEYDHLLGWAKVRRHVTEEITLLCDSHHRAKTAGFLPNARVIEADKDPINLRRGTTHPYNLHYSGSEFTIKVGTITFSGVDQGLGTMGQMIRIDGEPLLSVALEDSHFLLNVSVYNTHDELVLQIVNNELVLNAHSWDIELVGTRLIIRKASRNILFDMIFQPPSTVLVKRGRFLRNGVEVLVTPQWIAVLNNQMLFQNLALTNCYAGLVLGEDPDPPPAVFNFPGIIRDGWDRDAAIRWARESAAGTKSTEQVINDLLAIESFE
jgi:hypothetical protein